MLMEISEKYRCTGHKRINTNSDERSYRHTLPSDFNEIRCECGEVLHKDYLDAHVCHKVVRAVKRLESGLKRSKASKETIEMFLAEHYPQ